MESSHISESDKEIQRLNAELTDALSKLEKQVTVEKKFEESQLRFKTIFEQSKFGSKIINSDLSIIQVNPALQVMLGYSEKELVGTKITDYSYPEFSNHWHDLQESLWTKQIPSFQLDTCLMKKDGTTLWISVTSILFKDDDKRLGYTMLEDISQRKALEEKLQKHATMVNTDLENFVYTASHDLKSPIANIEGFTAAIKKKLPSEFLLDTNNSNLFLMLGLSIDRLKSTIFSLTEIAKAQKEDGDEELILVNELINEICADLSMLISDSQVIISKQIAVDKVTLYKKNLHHILQNIISNAIKYHSFKRIPEVIIDVSLQNKFLVIKVSDNGLGMAENHLKKLFTMFKRFHTHVEGTGIGLYITKRIITNMQGRIEVESKLDVGTIVSVYLPYYHV